MFNSNISLFKCWRVKSKATITCYRQLIVIYEQRYVQFSVNSYHEYIKMNITDFKSLKLIVFVNYLFFLVAVLVLEEH